MNLYVENVYTKTHNQWKRLQKISKKQKKNTILKTKRTLNTKI